MFTMIVDREMNIEKFQKIEIEREENVYTAGG